MDPHNLAALREALQEITYKYGGRQVRKQVIEVRQLRRKFNHSITLVRSVADATPGPGKYNCIMRALAMRHPYKLALRVMNTYGNVFIGSDFVKWLVTNEVLRVSNNVNDDDVIVYFNQGKATHAGIWRDGMVVSKWGLGHLWKHPPLQVPASYGSTTAAFMPIDSKTANRMFENYALGTIGTEAMDELRAP